VTLADPGNRFSFISYLHRHGRLHQFLNARFDQVSRLEFRDYLKWAAETNENISFGERALHVDFDGKYFVVETAKRRVLSDNVVVGVGIVPHIPAFAREHVDGTMSFHVNEYASKSGVAAGKRVVVVGGGQSGAEAVLDLIRRTGDDAPSSVTWVSRRENFFPLDDSPFANDYFTPSHSNYFYEQDSTFREAFLRRNILASDGISEHTLRNIYQRIYAMRYIERTAAAVELMPFREVKEIWRSGNGWSLAARHLADEAMETIDADIVIWASGFEPAPLQFLHPLVGRLERENGELRIDRDYAAIWDGPHDRNVFLLNSARCQRGLADPNLSLTAWRSQQIVNRMLGKPRNAGTIDDAFVSWSVATPTANRVRAGTRRNA
jgi:lysine N6-hydroxylase